MIHVKKILVPNKPQLDPIVAIYLLGQYGQEKFSGIDTAEIIFWEKGDSPTNEEIENFQDQGILPIDVGGGFFDHHNTADSRDETATTLVARYLDIEKRPELNYLLNYVREDDLAGLHNRYGELVHVIKSMYKQGMPTNKVIEFTLQVIHVMQEGQRNWHYIVREEYEEKKKIIKVKRYKRKLKAAIIESDNIQIANFAIAMDNVSVVIQKRSTGHIMILTNKHHKIDLREAVGAIRKKEAEIRGITKDLDPKRLQFEGTNSMTPMWFYHKSLNSFLNGSDALAKTEATQVPFRDIVGFVLYGLTTDESELCDCHETGENCPYHDYGFIKCQEKRKNIK